MTWARRIRQGGLGVVISLVAVYAVLQSVDLERTAAILRGATIGWIPLVAVSITVDVLLRALRWQRLLAPISAIGLGRVLDCLLVGYLANNVLPARLGELVRCHFLGDREGISRATVLGTVVVERVVDTAVVVAIAALAILALNVRGVLTDFEGVAIAVGALLAVGLSIAIAAHRLPGAAQIAGWFERWPGVGRVASRLRAGLAVAGRPKTLVTALILSTAAWSATLLGFMAAGRAVGLDMGIGEAALLSSAVALASAIPSGPAYLGTYELAAVKVGEALGLSPDPTFALALLVHVSIVVLTSAGGAVALRRLEWHRTEPGDALISG